MRIALALSMVACFLVLPAVTVADIGPKPTVTIEPIKYEGQSIIEARFYAKMLSCYEEDQYTGERLPPSYPENYELLENISMYDAARGCTWQPAQFAWGGECYASSCEFHYHLPETFRLAVLLPTEGRVYISEEVTRRNFDSLFDANLRSDGTIDLIETTPLVSSDSVRYFVMAFIVSIIIELIAAAAFKRRWNLSRRIFFAVIVANVISLPTVHFIIPTLISELFSFTLVSELFAILIEAVLIYSLVKREITFSRALSLGLIMNILSFIVGGFFYLFFLIV